MPHSATPSVPSSAAALEEAATPATQFVRDRDAYLGDERDVGRRVGDAQFELFVADEPAQALRREFERLQPPYVALHDVGASQSVRLLHELTATSGRLMRLAIRRQGQGVPLATVQFVELPGTDGSVLRVYSTDIDADTHARRLLARTLLAHARLGALVIGDLPTHALAANLQPLFDALPREHWPNRHLLMLPLGAASVRHFCPPFEQQGIAVQVAPQPVAAGDAWALIGDLWNRIEAGLPAAEREPRAPRAPGSSGAAGRGPEQRDDRHAQAYAPTQRTPLAPAPPPAPAARTPSADAPRARQTASIPAGPADIADWPTQPMGLRRDGRPAPGVDWLDYVQRCTVIKGMISCCVFDRRGHALAHLGGRPPAEVLQALGERLLATASDVGAVMGADPAVSEITISYATHHLLLHAVRGHPDVVLHAVLDAATGNVPVARAQLQRISPM